MLEHQLCIQQITMWVVQHRKCWIFEPKGFALSQPSTLWYKLYKTFEVLMIQVWQSIMWMNNGLSVFVSNFIYFFLVAKFNVIAIITWIRSTFQANGCNPIQSIAETWIDIHFKSKTNSNLKLNKLCSSSTLAKLHFATFNGGMYQTQ